MFIWKGETSEETLTLQSFYAKISFLILNKAIEASGQLAMSKLPVILVLQVVVTTESRIEPRKPVRTSAQSIKQRGPFTSTYTTLQQLALLVNRLLSRVHWGWLALLAAGFSVGYQSVRALAAGARLAAQARCAKCHNLT